MQEGDSLCGHHKFNAMVSVVQAQQFYTVRFSLLQLLRPAFSQSHARHACGSVLCRISQTHAETVCCMEKHHVLDMKMPISCWEHGFESPARASFSLAAPGISFVQFYTSRI
jgi:hypothetical protein